MKTIAVLLSSYNGEKYIEKQIDSILKQNVNANLKLVIRDDGSKDSTLKILEDYERKNTNISVIKGENIGYIPSFFRLINFATDADYYALSDQDDCWLEDKLQCAIDMLTEEEQLNPNIPLLYGSSSFLVDNDLKIYGETQKKRREMTIYNTMVQNIMPGHSQVFNQAFSEIVKNLNIDYDKIYVHDSFLANLAVIRGKIVFDNRSHTLYRQGDENTLGYGVGIVDWVKGRIKRVKKRDSNKYALQMKYIYDVEKSFLDKESASEIKRFFDEQDSLLKRLMYSFGTKFYRQRRIESLLFRLIYIIGGYNI